MMSDDERGEPVYSVKAISFTDRDDPYGTKKWTMAIMLDDFIRGSAIVHESVHENGERQYHRCSIGTPAQGKLCDPFASRNEAVAAYESYSAIPSNIGKGDVFLVNRHEHDLMRVYKEEEVEEEW